MLLPIGLRSDLSQPHLEELLVATAGFVVGLQQQGPPFHFVAAQRQLHLGYPLLLIARV